MAALVSFPVREAPRAAIRRVQPRRRRPRHRPYGFDLIRIVAASMVVWGHSQLLTRQHGTQFAYADREIALGTAGVIVFFAASGYLITGSWQRNPRLAHFALHRFFRIWPGLALSTIVVAFVVGPIWTTDSAYLTRPGTWSYVVRNLLIFPFQQTLPGVFLDSPVPEVSGTLWSLGVEVCCYLLVAACGLLGVLRHRRWVLLALLALTAAAGWSVLSDGALPNGIVARALPVTAFVGAVALRVYRVPLRGSYAAAAGAIVVGLAVVHAPTSILLPLLSLTGSIQ